MAASAARERRAAVRDGRPPRRLTPARRREAARADHVAAWRRIAASNPERRGNWGGGP